MYAFLRDFAHLAEREHLEPAAIRQNGPVPVHEFMQSARLANDLVSWPQKEMVRIAQDDPSIHFL
ncbi:hypothetical protein D3C74_356570 [compost metagenome]